MASEVTRPMSFPGWKVSLDDIRRQGETERQQMIPNAAKVISGIEGLKGSEAEIRRRLEMIRSMMPHDDRETIRPDCELTITDVKETLVGLSLVRPADPDAMLRLLRQFAYVAALTGDPRSLRGITDLTKAYNYKSEQIIANMIALARTKYNGLSFSKERQNDLIQGTARAISKAGNATQAEEISQEFLNLARQALLLSCLRVPDHYHSESVLR